MTIALIEDNAELRELTARFLKAEGFEVLALESAEALTEINATPSLFIIDLNLPHISGYTLIERLRKMSNDVGIIVVSARDRTSDISRGYLVGADVYLTKPVEPDILLAAVRRMTARAVKVQSSDNNYLVREHASSLSNGDETVRLTGSELRLLWQLRLAGSSGLERWELAGLLGLDLDHDFANALEARITRLRKKLRQVGMDGAAISAQRNSGYVLTVPIRFQP